MTFQPSPTVFEARQMSEELAAEREQGITIDVAYRFLSTERRSFIVADTPRHEQSTRNMATGASTADAAVLLVDVRKGLSHQTRRHALLVSTLRHVVLAVNKMDLVDWSAEVFARLDDAFRAFAAGLGFAGVTAIPLSAKHGDNVARRSPAAPWLVKSVFQFGHERLWTHLGVGLRSWSPEPRRSSACPHARGRP